MVKKKIIYDGISEKARQLLNCQEGKKVEFKESLTFINQNDFVSFANTEKGGTILIGIKEEQDESGLQKPVIKGCDIGDEQKLKIMNLSKNCIPPIEPEVIVENKKQTPFLRIEIKPGKNKPYCTQKGIYKIRSDGLNIALTPEKLLNIFLDKEEETFLKRFNESTEKLYLFITELVLKMGKLDRNMTPVIEQLKELFGKQNNPYGRFNSKSPFDELINKIDMLTIDNKVLLEKLNSIEQKIET